MESEITQRTRAVLEAAAVQALAAVETGLGNPEQFLVKGKDQDQKLDTKGLKEMVTLLRELTDLIREFSGEGTRELRVVFEAGEEAWND